jgi:hypothetical protein
MIDDDDWFERLDDTRCQHYAREQQSSKETIERHSGEESGEEGNLIIISS